MKLIFISIIFSQLAYANISGKFYSEFKRNNQECAIEANLNQKNINQITFKQWDELCEDSNGNSYQSSLSDVMTYEKIGSNKLKVTQGKDSIELVAKILDFSKDKIHYNFEVDTEDGHLEINDTYSLLGNDLSYTSIYILDGKEIINNSGIIQKKK